MRGSRESRVRSPHESRLATEQQAVRFALQQYTVRFFTLSSSACIKICDEARRHTAGGWGAHACPRAVRLCLLPHHLPPVVASRPARSFSPFFLRTRSLRAPPFSYTRLLRTELYIYLYGGSICSRLWSIARPSSYVVYVRTDCHTAAAAAVAAVAKLTFVHIHMHAWLWWLRK